MKKATAKIKEVVRTKDYTGNHGTTIYHDLIMDNGDKINIGKKTLQKVGWELSYEIVDEQSGEFMKSKSIKPEEVNGQSNYTPSSSGLNVQNLIVAQSCISSACVLHQQSMEGTAENVLQTAQKFYDWAINKGK